MSSLGFKNIALKAGLGAALVVGIATATPAHALPQFTLAPSALGGAAAGQAAITGDNILLSDFSTITFTPTGTPGQSTFVETGTLAITGFQNGLAPVVTPGLNTTYGLYFSFTAAGNQTNFTPLVSSGSFTSLNFTLFGYTIPPSSTPVTYTPNNNTPGGVVNPQVLATGSLVNGTVSVSPGQTAQNNTVGVPSANAVTTFNTVLTPFFVSPVPFYNLALSAFTNTTSQVSGSTAAGFTIVQGGGAANFDSSPVPEPMSLGLLGVGLAAAGMLRLRRQNG